MAPAGNFPDVESHAAQGIRTEKFGGCEPRLFRGTPRPALLRTGAFANPFGAMIDVIKKTLLAGVGAAVITKEKVESALGEFVQQGKVSSTEARQMAEKIAEQGRREFETMSQQVNDMLREKFTGAERKMQERVTLLEARVAALEAAGGTQAPPTSQRPVSA
jgi:polyhydroxyalkanoate synthesis regulator phasin